MRSILLCCVLAIGAGSGCSDVPPDDTSTSTSMSTPTPPALASPVVARVDGHAITQADVEGRLRVTRIYYPKDATPDVALADLIEGELALAVLRARDVELGPREIAAEAARIDRATRWPARLAEIKRVLGPDYERLFVRPLLARTRFDGELGGVEQSREIAIELDLEDHPELRRISWLEPLSVRPLDRGEQ
jgi:hypothetical protein